MRLVIGAMAVVCCVSTPVSARDYYYFNLPGVDRERYIEDRLECNELAGGAAREQIDSAIADRSIYNSNLSTGQAAAAVGIASFLGAFISGARNRRLQWQIERICLADKGYRRFEISKARFNEIDNVENDAERVDLWFSLATTDEPEGEEMFE